MRLSVAVSLALVLPALGCYSPNYESKPCQDKKGCPEGYYCVNKLCSLTPQLGGGSDGGTTGIPQPAEVRVDITQMPQFTIGAPVAEDPQFKTNDTPAHIRSLSKSFYLDQKEVTVALYTKCVDAGACKPADVSDPVRCNYTKTDKTEHPINCVDYSRAVAFCTWIGRRLPTETEWEYAAKGTSSATLYSFGQSWDMSKVCFAAGGTCPVGSKGVKTYQGREVLSSQDGFYDLSGNVNEWTKSEFCPYSTTMEEGQGCGSTTMSVRGGSGYDTNMRSQTVSARFGNLKTETFDYRDGMPTGGHYNLGLRCARDAP